MWNNCLQKNDKKMAGQSQGETHKLGIPWWLKLEKIFLQL